jgi:hypothetical protein
MNFGSRIIFAFCGKLFGFFPWVAIITVLSVYYIDVQYLLLPWARTMISSWHNMKILWIIFMETPVDHWRYQNCIFGVGTWWLIPLSKWVITPVINGISRVNPLITGVNYPLTTHLLSGMNHQVAPIQGTGKSSTDPLVN